MLRVGRRNGVVGSVQVQSGRSKFSVGGCSEVVLEAWGEQVNGLLVDRSGMLLDLGSVTYWRLVEANERQEWGKFDSLGARRRVSLYG